MPGSALRVRDYADSGLNIQQALLDHHRRFPDQARRPDYILWGGIPVKTCAALPVPTVPGVLRLEFVSTKGKVEQGVDLTVAGWIRMAKVVRGRTVRLWSRAGTGLFDFRFYSEDGRLWIWNVYKRAHPDGQVAEERWTGNAGFWVEARSLTDHVFHCSHGLANPPDFESMVIRITVNP